MFSFLLSLILTEILQLMGLFLTWNLFLVLLIQKKNHKKELLLYICDEF